MTRHLLEKLDHKFLALVKAIGALADGVGMRAYLVGGPVRDLVLKHRSIDLDITVEGSGMRLAAMFASLRKGAQLTRYPAFKTATVVLEDGTAVDFATARKETYARSGAFPAVVPSNIHDDLFRRDFTVNAMAIVLNKDGWGTVVDPFDGLVDMRAKKIRVMHDQSFIDDPTRILRAARFAGRLSFAVESKTLKLIKAALNGKALDSIKPQRYLKEFQKLLVENNPKPALQYLESWEGKLSCRVLKKSTS